LSIFSSRGTPHVYLFRPKRPRIHSVDRIRVGLGGVPREQKMLKYNYPESSITKYTSIRRLNPHLHLFRAKSPRIHSGNLIILVSVPRRAAWRWSHFAGAISGWRWGHFAGAVSGRDRAAADRGGDALRRDAEPGLDGQVGVDVGGFAAEHSCSGGCGG